VLAAGEEPEDGDVVRGVPERGAHERDERLGVVESLDVGLGGGDAGWVA
jgi:hypothetical protein